MDSAVLKRTCLSRTDRSIYAQHPSLLSIVSAPAVRLEMKPLLGVAGIVRDCSINLFVSVLAVAFGVIGSASQMQLCLLRLV